MVQFHIADDVPQRGGGQTLYREDRALHAIGVQLGVGHLIKDDGVDLHGDVILGNNRLRRKVHDLLLERNLLGYAVNNRNFQVQTGLPGAVISAETLNDKHGGLRYNADIGNQ